TEKVPSPGDFAHEEERVAVEKALTYMGLKPGMKITDIEVETVFIGSCTNARLSDLIEAARVISRKKKSPRVRAMVVPGSQSVKKQAETIGLDRIFVSAG